MIQGGSLVGKDVPPYATVGGEPVRFFVVNRIGLGRRGFTPEQVSEIGEMSRIMFQNGLDYATACDQIEEKYPQSAHRDTLVGFVRGSQRGVCKPAAV